VTDPDGNQTKPKTEKKNLHHQKPRAKKLLPRDTQPQTQRKNTLVTLHEKIMVNSKGVPVTDQPVPQKNSEKKTDFKAKFGGGVKTLPRRGKKAGKKKRSSTRTKKRTLPKKITFGEDKRTEST